MACLSSLTDNDVQKVYLSNMEHSLKSQLNSNMSSQVAKQSINEDKVTVSNKEIKLRITNGLKHFRKQEMLCDVRIKTEDKVVLAHKVVLAIHSDYFQAMFTVGLQETHTDQIELPGMRHDIISALVDYMYTGSLTITSENSQDLLVAADMMNLQEIKQTVGDFIQRRITVLNCLGIAQFGDQMNCPRLVEKSMFLIKQRFLKIRETQDFLELSATWLLKILNIDDLFLGPEGEAEVFKAAFEWVLHDPASRGQYVSDILKSVRLSRITEECLNNLIQTYPVINDIDIKQCVTDVLQSSESAEERKPVRYIFAVGGYLQARTGPLCPRLTAVEVYNLDTREWSRLAHHLPVLPSGAFTFNMSSQLLCVVYELGVSQQSMCKLLQYDYVVNTWRDQTSGVCSEALKLFQDCFSCNGAFTFCDKTNSIYTVTMESVAKIPIVDDDDSFSLANIHSMPKLEFEVEGICEDYGCIVLDGQLYVVGGCDIQSQNESSSSDALYRYDTERREWIKLQNMNEARASFGIAELDGHIYVVGGYNTRRLCTAERYDPKTETWISIACMNRPRSHLQIVAVAGKLWALGGKSYATNVGGARKVISSCEMYDPQTNTWTFFHSMVQARCLFGAVVL